MLETVRHFAVERLEEAGAGELRRRHAEWLTELAETMAERTTAGEDATVWLDRIQPEHDNIRAALAWSLEDEPELALRLASSLRLFWEVRGHFSEGCSWIEDALPYADDVAPLVRLRALSASGAIASPARRPRPGAGALRSGARARAGARRRALDRPPAQRHRHGRGRCSRSTTKRARCSRRAPTSSASSTCRPGSRRCSATSATSPASAATTTRAIEVTEEALSLESNHKRTRRSRCYNLGSHNLQAGHLERAREWLERAIAHTLELGFKEVMAYSLAAFVRLCLLEGDARRAAYLAGIADRLLADAGLLLQPSEQALFDEAKATAEQRARRRLRRRHDAAMAAPLEEALREGGVLAEVPASP